MPAAAPVSVDSLHLRDGGAHRDALLASLDDIRWPAADGQQYLILRQVRVQAPWWQAAELLAQDTRALAAGAVSGWDARAADAAAVRFADLADLLACLSHDLARGRVAGLWYWRNWRRFLDGSPAAALTRLWCEHPALLPDLVAALAVQRVLPLICTCLDQTSVSHIMDSVRHATGWQLPTPGRDAQPGASSDRPALPKPRLHDWQQVLQTLPRHDLHTLLPLLALTTGWQQLPQLLHDSSHWLAWCREIARLLPVTAQTQPARQLDQPRGRQPLSGATPATPAADPATQAIKPARTGSDDLMPPDSATAGPVMPATAETHSHSLAAAPITAPEQPVASRPAEGQTQAPPRGASVEWNAGSPAAPAPAAGDDRQALAQVAAMSPSPTQDDATVMRTGTLPDESDTAQPAGGTHFHTRQGGLFYLLNVLAHPAIAPCLADAVESGWHRLYRLGLHLELDCDPPLARYLAHQLDLADPARLPELAALRNEAQLCRLADRHYAHLAAWGPELLAVPAQAIHGRSHLDLYYPLGAVRLEIRRAGLDIDPGWLPWLGQVVHFHYREPLATAGDTP